jgi:hypothetical protein
MNLPGESINFGSQPESDAVQTLRDGVDQFFLDQGLEIGILYDTVDTSRPIIRVMGGKMPSAAYRAFVNVYVVSLSIPEQEQSTTISIDQQQFVLDKSGVRRIDAHRQEVDEEAVIVEKMQECITPGLVLWAELMTRLRTKEVLELHRVWDRKA